jgi:CheY-like chemotaxis protein
MNARLILVVEDERLIARDITMQLRELGHTPLGPANTGEQAIEMANLLRPDLVLMDVHLGSAMDGISAAMEIREKLGTPVVFLSAFNTAESLARAKKAEPAGYLSKPFMEYELSDMIKSIFP